MKPIYQGSASDQWGYTVPGMCTVIFLLTVLASHGLLSELSHHLSMPTNPEVGETSCTYFPVGATEATDVNNHRDCPLA